MLSRVNVSQRRGGNFVEVAGGLKEAYVCRLTKEAHRTRKLIKMMLKDSKMDETEWRWFYAESVRRV